MADTIDLSGLSAEEQAKFAELLAMATAGLAQRAEQAEARVSELSAKEQERNRQKDPNLAKFQLPADTRIPHRFESHAKPGTWLVLIEQDRPNLKDGKPTGTTYVVGGLCEVKRTPAGDCYLAHKGNGELALTNVHTPAVWASPDCAEVAAYYTAQANPPAAEPTPEPAEAPAA